MNRVKSLRQTRSIRTKIILGLLVVLIPLISLLLTYNFYTVTLLREKTAVSNKNTLSIYSEIVEANLQATRGQLLDTFTADNNFYKIRNSENPVSQYLATYDASKRFQSLLASGSTADLFFIYTPQHHLTFFNETFNSSLAFSERLTIRTELKNLAQAEDRYQRYDWLPFQIGEDTYLINILGNDGIYLGAAIRLRDMVFPLAKGKLFEDYRMLYVTPDGQALTEQAFAAEKKLDLSPSQDIYTLSGFPDRFMILSETLDLAPVRMVAALPDPTFLTTFNAVRATLDQLRAMGLKLAIGSSSKNAPFILERIGLGDYFDVISDGNNISQSKPEPEVFLKAAEYLGLPTEACVVVEDAVAGVEAADRASMVAIAIGDAGEQGAGEYQVQAFGELVGICMSLKTSE